MSLVGTYGTNCAWGSRLDGIIDRNTDDETGGEYCRRGTPSVSLVSLSPGSSSLEYLSLVLERTGARCFNTVPPTTRVHGRSMIRSAARPQHKNKSRETTKHHPRLDSAGGTVIVAMRSWMSENVDAKTADDAPIRFERLFDTDSGTTRERLVQLSQLRIQALAQLPARGKQKHKEKTPDKTPLSYKDQLEYASRFSSLYHTLTTNRMIGTNVDCPPLAFRRGYSVCKHLEFEMTGAIVDAATRFIHCINKQDEFWMPTDEQDSTLEILDFASMIDRPKFIQDGRRVIGLLNYGINKVIPNWIGCPPCLVQCDLFSSNALQSYKLWIRSYICFAMGMITWSANPTGAEHIQSTTRSFLTSRHLLEQCNGAISLAKRTPVTQLSSAIVVEAEDTRIDVAVDTESKLDTSVFSRHPEPMPWYDVVPWIFLAHAAATQYHMDEKLEAAYLLSAAIHNGCPYGYKVMRMLAHKDSLFQMQPADKSSRMSCAQVCKNVMERAPLREDTAAEGVPIPVSDFAINLMSYSTN